MLKNQPPKLNKREERLVNALQALGDKTRFRIFKLLLSGKELCVTEIAEALNVSAPAVSQHFRIFELNGLVDKKRYGHKICYILRDQDELAHELINLTSPNNQLSKKG